MSKQKGFTKGFLRCLKSYRVKLLRFDQSFEANEVYAIEDERIYDFLCSFQVQVGRGVVPCFQPITEEEFLAEQEPDEPEPETDEGNEGGDTPPTEEGGEKTEGEGEGEGETDDAPTPAAEGEQPAEEAVSEWKLSTSPAEYLNQYGDKAPNSALAKRLVAAQKK